MSHVVTIDVHIKDLESLQKACEEIGLDFMEGQKTFKWFGRHIGDYAIPKLFTKGDMGKCDHALRVKGNSHAYEIGVCSRRDGKSGYIFMYDFWGGGYGLEKVVGKKLKILTNAYTKAVAKKEAKAMARKKNYSVTESVNEKGEAVLTLRKY
ncbi:MAG: hypothetical protein AABY32_03945 [Nanoarchaeota archaeon]